MNPPPNFDRIARIYRWAEYLSLGPLLQQTRTHFLAQLIICRQALVLGDGDGRFLAALLSHNLQLQTLAVDTSAAMLTQLRNRCQPFATRLATQQTSALTVIPTPATDLIVTHFFLDCLTQADVDQLSLRLASHVAPGTLWLLSDFRIPKGPLRPLATTYIRALYLAFRILTGLRVTHLPDPQSALTAAGFSRLHHHRTLGGLLYTELWQRSPLPSQATISTRNPASTATISSFSPMNQPTDIQNNRPAPHLSVDAQPDPEPAAPSLPAPDPGVFNHDPAASPEKRPEKPVA